MAKTTDTNLSNYLSDVDFPARKTQILNAAKNKNAPQDVIQQIQNMPDREFKQASDVQDVLRQRTQQGGMQGKHDPNVKGKEGQGNQGQRSGRGREEE